VAAVVVVVVVVGFVVVVGLVVVAGFVVVVAELVVLFGPTVDVCVVVLGTVVGGIGCGPSDT
jgi:hypothetical protein